MAVQVHGVGVVGAVAEDEAVALALLKDKLPVVRVGLAVDEPCIQDAGAARDLLEDHVDGVVGGSGGVG